MAMMDHKSLIKYVDHANHRRTCLAVCLILVAATTASAQPASRWSTSSPPTPAVLKSDNEPKDNGLRRLPPIDEQASSPAASVAMTSQPQSRRVVPSSPPKAAEPDPVDWSTPKVVVGPSPSINAVANQSSRYSTPSANGATLPALKTEPPKTSRFSSKPANQNASSVRLPTSEMPEERSSEPVFARVFDETEPEVMLASAEEGVSSIFICRILGFPAIATRSGSR